MAEKTNMGGMGSYSVCPQGASYTVRPGETLGSIAAKFGVSLGALEAANPQIAKPDLIYPGQVVCVPLPSAAPVTCPNGTLYVVRAGDTMFDIAVRHGLTLQALLSANPQITEPTMIAPGDVICIPARPMMPVPPPPVVISPIVTPWVPSVPQPTQPPMPEMPVPPPAPCVPPTVPSCPVTKPACPFLLPCSLIP